MKLRRLKLKLALLKMKLAISRAHLRLLIRLRDKLTGQRNLNL